MSRRERVRWGILSASSTALTKAIPALQRCANATVVAIGSRDPEKARRHASSLGIGKTYGSYDALLEDPEVDAVYVSVPNAFHAEWTCRAAEAGKHVLCEKPAALTGEDAGTMLAACEQNGVLFMEGLKHRFHPQLAYVKRLLGEGRIGEVRLLRITFSFTLDERHSKIRLERSLGGGALADLGVYAIDLSSHLLNARPARVFATGSRGLGVDVETDFAAILEFPEGRRALLDGAFDQPRQNSCDVVGQSGVIQITSPFLPVESAAVRVHTAGQPVEQTFPAIDLFQMELEHFSSCVLDSRAPAITGEDTVANAEVLAALQRSLAIGQATFPFCRTQER
ncbi:MAG: Gfo/Idh/MocA family oxidoreductase [Acidobacteria bacterium]|nr:Gfo/Idh/MocA family oxidoreductase [Acidobacteriota bacterium]